MATHVSDYTKESKDIVLDLINADNGTAFTHQQVNMSAPRIDGQKTALTLRGKPLAGHKGSDVVRYDRIGLSELPLAGETLYSETISNMQDMLNQFNAMHGLSLTAADITIEGREISGLEPVAYPLEEPLGFTFAAKPTSFVWVGEHEFLFQGHRVYQIPELIATDTLDGLYSDPDAPIALVTEPLLDFPIEKHSFFEAPGNEDAYDWGFKPFLNANGTQMVVGYRRPMGTGGTTFAYRVFNITTEPPTEQVHELPVLDALQALYPGVNMVLDSRAQFSENLSVGFFGYMSTDGSVNPGVITFDVSSGAANPYQDFPDTWSIDMLLASQGRDVLLKAVGEEAFTWWHRNPTTNIWESTADRYGQEGMIFNFNVSGGGGGPSNLCMVGTNPARELLIYRANTIENPNLTKFTFQTPVFVHPDGEDKPYTLVKAHSSGSAPFGTHIVALYSREGGDYGIAAFLMDKDKAYAIGNIPSVMLTNELYGDMVVGNIISKTAPQNSTVAYLSFYGNTGRPNMPGQGAVAIYCVKAYEAKKAEFYSIGEFIQPKWTNNGHPNVNRIGRHVSGATNTNRGVVVAGEDAVEFYTFKSDYNPNNIL